MKSPFHHSAAEIYEIILGPWSAGLPIMEVREISNRMFFLKKKKSGIQCVWWNDNITPFSTVGRADEQEQPNLVIFIKLFLFWILFKFVVFGVSQFFLFYWMKLEKFCKIMLSTMIMFNKDSIFNANTSIIVCCCFLLLSSKSF